MMTPTCNTYSHETVNRVIPGRPHHEPEFQTKGVSLNSWVKEPFKDSSLLKRGLHEDSKKRGIPVRARI